VKLISAQPDLGGEGELGAQRSLCLRKILTEKKMLLGRENPEVADKEKYIHFSEDIRTWLIPSTYPALSKSTVASLAWLPASFPQTR
jgi:hypothetical protein